MTAIRCMVPVLALNLVAAATCLAQVGGQRGTPIPWVQGPVLGELGPEARVRVPGGCAFTGQDGVRQFMEATQNPVSGAERGVVVCQTDGTQESQMWFVVFSYDPSGYVKDDERNQLDAEKILESIRRATDESNRQRRQRGWGTLSVEGWVSRPHYDLATHNLTWALSARDDSGVAVVNNSVRVLGRGGVMHVDLVTSPATLQTVLPAFGQVVAGFEYLPGSRYAEWRAGDKVASYGLTALVAGGAGAVLVKTGLLAKFWKVLVAAAVAALAGLKKFWSRATDRKTSQATR